MSTSALAARQNAKHEKILRELSKLEGNRQCMTCQGHGGRAPQYACTTFGTFVCTTCSGVHREDQVLDVFHQRHLALHARGGQDDAGRRKRRRARQVPRGVVRHPDSERRRSAPWWRTPRGDPSKTSSGRCSTRGSSKATLRPPPKHKHKPKPTPRIRTERSVTPWTDDRRPTRASTASPAVTNDDPFGLGAVASPLCVRRHHPRRSATGWSRCRRRTAATTAARR